MAVCLSKSSFIGTSFPAHPSASGVAAVGSRRRNQSLLTIVSHNSTLGVHGSENSYRKQREEASSSVRADDEKPRAAWWEPLFNVSAEDQWSKLLADSSTSAGRLEQPPMSARSEAVASTAIPLQNIIESAKNERQVVASAEASDKTGTTNERKRRTSTVIFTPEKARLLRERLRGSEVWHDGWYHSAIASRKVEESN